VKRWLKIKPYADSLFARFAMVTSWGLAIFKFSDDHGASSLFFIGAAFLITAVGIFLPHALRPVNYVWAGIGLAVSRVTKPIALAVLYFLVITPIGLCLRLRRHDSMRTKRRSGVQSYWEPYQKANSMKTQF
jgi:sorbitol-specific phosphotransferase system component IIC